MPALPGRHYPVTQREPQLGEGDDQKSVLLITDFSQDERRQKIVRVTDCHLCNAKTRDSLRLVDNTFRAEARNATALGHSPWWHMTQFVTEGYRKLLAIE
jgi:hypothetical protein